MGIQEKIAEIQLEMARTQKNKATEVENFSTLYISNVVDINSAGSSWTVESEIGKAQDPAIGTNGL